MFTWPQKKVRDLVLKYEQFNNDDRNRFTTTTVSKNKNVRCSKFYVNTDICKKIDSLNVNSISLHEKEKQKRLHSNSTSFEENRKVANFKKMYSLQSITEFKTISTKEKFLESEYKLYILKCINPIVQELLETEKTYVKALKKGIKKYSEIFKWSDLPTELNGQEFELLGNVNEIFELHEQTVLPMMVSNIDKLSLLIEKFLRLFDICARKRSIHDIYFDFILKMKISQQLRHKHATFFQSLQTKLSDPLGINSFLMQPITRPTKYPLLINSILKAIFNAKMLISKADIDNCCKLLKQTKSLLDCMNKAGELNSIEELPFILDWNLRPYKLTTNFDIYDSMHKRHYNGKVFLFNDMIICTEQLRTERLIYRECYPYNHVGIETINGNCFRLFYDRKGLKELELYYTSNIIINEWIALIGNMLNIFIGEEKLRLLRKYSISYKNDVKFQFVKINQTCNVDAHGASQNNSI